MSKIIQHKTLAMQVYHLLENMIINNELKPGEVLYLEKLADKFGVSITPIRQAFLKLETSNLVYFKSNGCAYVKNIDEKAAEEIWDYRMLIECYASRHVAEKIADEEITEIEKKLLLTSQDPENFSIHHDADNYLHTTLTKYCNNEHIRRALQYIEPNLARVRYFSIQASDFKNIRYALEEHERILDAIKDRDPKGIPEALSEHLKRGKQRMLDSLRLFSSRGPDVF